MYEALVHHLCSANTCSNVVWQLCSVPAYGCWVEKGELIFVRVLTMEIQLFQPLQGTCHYTQNISWFTVDMPKVGVWRLPVRAPKDLH